MGTLFNTKAESRVPPIISITLMISPTANWRAWSWQFVKWGYESISASLLVLNIYCFRLNIFKKGTFNGLFEKRTHCQKTLGGKTPCPPLCSGGPGLRFTRLRRSYVNRTDVVPTNLYQSYTTFLLDMRCSKWPRSFFFFFCSCLSAMIVHLRNLFLLSTRVARTLLTPRWINRRKDVKYLSINISKLTLGVNHFISRRTTFSPNLHLVDEETLERFPILQH